MIVIHRTERFDRCLEELRQDGGESAIAAEKAEQLIREIAQGGLSSLEQRWKTNNGEARIEGCRKFYIGRRYRLVCIKQGKQSSSYMLVPTTIATAGWIVTGGLHSGWNI